LGLYSLREQIIFGLTGTIYFPNEKYILVLENSFSKFPDKFWGIGNKTPDSNEESYQYKQFYIYPHLQRRVYKDFYVGVLYEFQKLFDVEYGGRFLENTDKTVSLFDKQNVAGRYGSTVSGLGFSLTWDTRISAFSPHKGLFAQMKYNNFNKIVGSQFEYWNLWFDVRKFIPVSKKTTLAIQGYAFLNEGDVPIRSLAALGGSNNMRGYYDGRFRGKSQLSFQAEYRFPIWWRFGGVAFASFGDVSDKLSNFDLRDFKHSYGAGLRVAVNRKEKLNIRIDYGWGQGNSHGLYFYLGEAF
jgi:outer membrane protein assembly factor BamA